MVRTIADDGLLLHIGAPKTATTSVQSAFARARPALDAAGILYPGRGLNHVRALRAAIGWPSSPQRREIDVARWQELREQVRSHRGRVVVTAETLVALESARASTVVDDLGHPNVDVVLTVRALAERLPSAWQEDVKAGSAVTYETWLREQCRGPSASRPVPSPFWIAHDDVATIERWSAVVGRDHVFVVVVDRAAPRRVFEAFEGLLGLDGEPLGRDPGQLRNRSLGRAETELLRRLNERRRLDRDRIFALAATLADDRVRDGERPSHAVPPWAKDRVGELGRELSDGIRASGVSVIGDLELLARSATDGIAGDESIDELSMDAAAAIVLELLAQGERGIGEVDR